MFQTIKARSIESGGIYAETANLIVEKRKINLYNELRKRVENARRNLLMSAIEENPNKNKIGLRYRDGDGSNYKRVPSFTILREIFFKLLNQKCYFKQIKINKKKLKYILKKWLI